MALMHAGGGRILVIVEMKVVIGAKPVAIDHYRTMPLPVPGIRMRTKRRCQQNR